MTGLLQGGRLARGYGFWLGVMLAGALVAGAARAQDAQPQVGDAAPGYSEAIAEAVDHYSAGRWRRAQEAFARAHALQPSARTYRGLGLANFYLENFAVAREAFEQALADTRKPLADDQRSELAELLRACERETGRFELRIAPEGARVELDGATIEQRTLTLDRGDHVIAVSAAAHQPERIVLTVAGGEQRAVEVSLATAERATPATIEAASEGPRPPLVDDYAQSEPTSGDGRVLTWVAAAAVPVFAGVGAGVWFTGKAERDAIEDECAIDRCNAMEGQRRFDEAGLDAHETWASVSLAASGVALVAAVVLFVVEGAEPSGTGLEAGLSGGALSGRF